MRPAGARLGRLLFGGVFSVALATAPADAAAPSPERPAAAPSNGPSAADVRLANDLYKTGLVHVKAGDWEAARAAFSRALELYPRPVILANLAGAEVRTGRVVSGVEHYREVLKEPTGMSASDIELVQSAMSDAEARLAHLRIVVANRTSADTVELDGVPLSAAALEVAYPVDPGKHVVTAARPGSESARVEVDVNEGDAKPIWLSPRLLPMSLSSPPPMPPRKPITSSPWFWVVGGVVLGGAAAAVACIAGACSGERGYQGNLGAVTLP